MKKDFERCLEAVLKHEGGFVNNPHDPGGATCNGVTQTVYNDWRGDRNLEHQSVRLISHDEVLQIYHELYWIPVKGDSLPAGVDYCVFDFGFNSGCGRAIRFLQNTVNVVADGQFGPATKAAVEAMPPKTFIITYCAKRLRFLKQLKTWQYFGRGWDARVKSVAQVSLEMVDEA